MRRAVKSVLGQASYISLCGPRLMTKKDPLQEKYDFFFDKVSLSAVAYHREF